MNAFKIIIIIVFLAIAFVVPMLVVGNVLILISPCFGVLAGIVIGKFEEFE